MTPKQFSKVVAKINRHKEAIGKHRDALRDIHSELADILEDADAGIDCLETAVDYLSRYI